MPKERSKPQPESAPLIADGMTLGVIGAGVMGQTLIKGLLASGLIARERV
jgi:phosphoglycerate dehydrogenase-like enzyme